MTVSLFGSLSRFSATELIRFFAENSKSGVLVIEAGGGFRVAFEDGRITSAAHDETGVDENQSELVIRSMLQETGNFAVLDLPGEPERVVDLDPLPLIAQALERIEESRDYDPASVFLLARDLESAELFPGDEVRLLLEVNGRTSAADIAERCGLSEEKARKLFGSLVRRGWLISRQGSKADPRSSNAAATPSAGGGIRETTPAIRPDRASETTSESEVAQIACFTLDDTNSTSFPLFDEVHTIGRASHNSIRLEDKSVSSSHAKITRTPDGYLLEDLGSSNGTFVNGEKIKESLLADKDRLRLGTVFMVFMLPTELREASGQPDKKTNP